MEQIGLLSQKLEEINDERHNFTNLIKTDMKKIIDNIIQHLSSDNNQSSRIKAQELSSFYKSLINYIEEKTASENIKYFNCKLGTFQMKISTKVRIT